MNLYTVELRVNETLDRFPLELSGFLPLSTVGGWSVPSDRERYFGQSSGTWRIFEHQGDSMIQLMEWDDPNFISWLWRDMPYSVAHLSGILKFPLFPGETGDGFISGKPPHHRPGNKKPISFSLGWRLSRRHF